MYKLIKIMAFAIIISTLWVSCDKQEAFYRATIQDVTDVKHPVITKVKTVAKYTGQEIYDAELLVLWGGCGNPIRALREDIEKCGGMRDTVATECKIYFEPHHDSISMVYYNKINKVIWVWDSDSTINSVAVKKLRDFRKE